MPNYDPLLTMSALNMAIVSLHRITSSGDRLILDREYDRIINNLRMGEINPDPELKELYLKIVRVIQNGRLREDVRAAIRQADTDKKRKSIKEIITGNVLKSFSTNPLKWLGKLAMSSASEYFTQEKEAERDKSNDKEELRLRRDELDEYAELQLQLIDSSWSLLHQYHIPDKYRVAQSALTQISSIMNEPDPANRHEMMEYLERECSMYAPYWLYRAKFASESGSDDEAEECFARFDEVWRPVLRKDPYRAEAMKFRIERLMRSGVNQNNAGEILKCLAEMREHTDTKDWANNIFAGMIYFSLGMRDEAVKCVRRNVLFHYEEEMSSQVLERMKTEEFPPRVEPLPVSEPEPEPPAREELSEPPVTMSDDDFLKLCRSGDSAQVEEAVTNGANVNAKSYKGKTALMFAITNGDSEVAEVLIKHGANVNARNNYGRTALMEAAREGQTELAKILLANGADVNARNSDGWTALIIAALNDKAELAEVLLTHGADVNAANNDGWTALMHSALNDEAEAAEVLLAHGANVNVKDNNGTTALMSAAQEGKTEVVEALLKHGADVNVKNNNGKTALMFAEEGRHREIISLLRSHGAKTSRPEPPVQVTEPVQEGQPAPKPKTQPMSDYDFLKLCKSGDAVKVQEAITNGADVNARNNYDGLTALMWAARHGHADVVEVLMKHGADVNAKNNDGWTALMHSALNDEAEAAEVLLAHGANVNVKDNNGTTALMSAAQEGKTEVVEALLKHGADVNVKNNNGKTALMFAEEGRHREIISLIRSHGAKKSKPEPPVQVTEPVHKEQPVPKPKPLLMSNYDFIALCKSGDAVKVEEAITNGADVNAKNNEGKTALMWAAMFGHADVAEILLKHGANVNAKDNDGWTALMKAAKYGHADVAEVLLKHGADVNANNNNGKTALMFAAENGHADVAEVLLKHGADVNAEDDDGMTALMFAAGYGHVDVAEVLLKHGANVNAKYNDGKTALMNAAENGQADVADVLLKHGADVNAKDKYGKTALMFAEEGRHREIISLFRSHGAKKSKPEPPAQKAEPVQETQKTPKPKPQPMSDYDFIELCKSGDAVKVQKAISNGANVNAKDNDGRTTLMYAALNGQADVAEVLLKHGADLNAKRPYYDCETALMDAAREGHADVAEILLKHGADVNAKDVFDRTALMWAARKGHADVAEILLEHGADVNAKAIYKNTALMDAAEYGHAEVAEVLLKHGAEVNAKNMYDNNTALMLAKENNRREVVKLLRSYGAKEGFFSRLFSE